MAQKKVTTFNAYKKSVAFLEAIPLHPSTDYMHKKTKRSFFLKRFAFFLNALGNPHKHMRYIHVGGSSGKGSVASMVHNILVSAGVTTGLYTSPHCTTTIERIKVDKKFISPDEFVQLTKKIKPALKKTMKYSPWGRPSYFEVLTAMAFLYFKKKKCEYVILEVGLGGRHDATNIIHNSDISIINTIGYDHTQILGNTLEKIATEKAQIIKQNSLFFTTAFNKKSVKNIFRKTCAKKNAVYHEINKPATKYKLSLLGEHQQQNAAVAEAATMSLGIKQKAVLLGLKRTHLPCRFEIIQKKPFIILDGAHNESKMKSTVETLRCLTYKKLYIIIALTKNRNPKVIFRKLTNIADEVIITTCESSDRKFFTPTELAKHMIKNRNVKTFENPDDALMYVLKKMTSNDALLVTGSFYLAGHLRKNWRPETKILKERIY